MWKQLSVRRGILVSTLLFASCSSEDNSGEAVIPLTPSTSVGEGMSASKSGFAEIGLRTDEGWEYKVILSLPVSQFASLGVDVSTSPPGRARLSSVIEPTSIQVFGTIEGRTAPELVVRELFYVWEVDISPDTDLGELSRDGACTWDRERASELLAVRCYPRYDQRSLLVERNERLSDEGPESAANAIAQAISLAPTLVYLRLGGPIVDGSPTGTVCEIALDPDGLLISGYDRSECDAIGPESPVAAVGSAPEDSAPEDSEPAKSLPGGVNLVPSASPLTEASFEEVVLGTGPVAKEGSSVLFHFYGSPMPNQDSLQWDTRGEDPLEIVIGENRFHSGIEDGLIGMSPGGIRRLEIPANEEDGNPDEVIYVQLVDILS